MGSFFFFSLPAGGDCGPLLLFPSHEVKRIPSEDFIGFTSSTGNGPFFFLQADEPVKSASYPSPLLSWKDSLHLSLSTT